MLAVDRVNGYKYIYVFVLFSVLSVVCAETVAVRMYSPTSSAEPMLTSCPRSDHGDGWMYVLRIYLSGDVEDLQSLQAMVIAEASREEQRPCCCLC